MTERRFHWTGGLRTALCLCLLLGGMACTPSPVSDSDETSGDETTEAEPPRRTYHVQVRTVEEKAAADRTVSDIVAWFEALPDADRPEPLSGVGDVPVDVRWKAPFYRVRIGPFSSRDAATAVLDALKSDFPDAFIAREAVGSKY